MKKYWNMSSLADNKVRNWINTRFDELYISEETRQFQPYVCFLICDEVLKPKNEIGRYLSPQEALLLVEACYLEYHVIQLCIMLQVHWKLWNCLCHYYQAQATKKRCFCHLEFAIWMLAIGPFSEKDILSVHHASSFLCSNARCQKVQSQTSTVLVPFHMSFRSYWSRSCKVDSCKGIWILIS